MRANKNRAGTKKNTGKAIPKGLERQGVLVEKRAPLLTGTGATGNPNQSTSSSCGTAEWLPMLPMEADLAQSSPFQSSSLQAIPIEKEMARLALENHTRGA